MRLFYLPLRIGFLGLVVIFITSCSRTYFTYIHNDTEYELIIDIPINQYNDICAYSTRPTLKHATAVPVVGDTFVVYKVSPHSYAYVFAFKNDGSLDNMCFRVTRLGITKSYQFNIELLIRHNFIKREGENAFLMLSDVILLLSDVKSKE